MEDGCHSVPHLSRPSTLGPLFMQPQPMFYNVYRYSSGVPMGVGFGKCSRAVHGLGFRGIFFLSIRCKRMREGVPVPGRPNHAGGETRCA